MDCILTDQDIPWALARLPLLEYSNVLAMDDLELLEHALLQQVEIRALRALARAGINTIHTLTRELEQQRRYGARLRDELRAARP